MFIKEFIEKTRYERVSKHGKKHTYYRNKTVVLLRCDNCDKIFNRLRGAMDPNRINNNVFHVCDTCDSKKFAQKMGRFYSIITAYPCGGGSPRRCRP